MREIKFRAYSKDTGMFNVAGEDVQSEEYRLFVPKCILMQYVGLKDKNGKEIYEGDIVLDFEGSDHERIRIMRWFESAAGFLNTNLAKEKRVIGNIYEHQELLKIAKPK